MALNPRYREDLHLEVEAGQGVMAEPPVLKSAERLWKGPARGTGRCVKDEVVVLLEDGRTCTHAPDQANGSGACGGLAFPDRLSVHQQDTGARATPFQQGPRYSDPCKARPGDEDVVLRNSHRGSLSGAPYTRFYPDYIQSLLAKRTTWLPVDGERELLHRITFAYVNLIVPLYAGTSMF